MLEWEIEQYLVNMVRQKIRGECLKWVCPGHAGVPDRVVITPPGRVLFVEVKRPGETLRPLQAAMHRRLAGLGADCRVVASREEVDRLVAELGG